MSKNSKKIKENVATVKKSISLIFCQFESLGKYVKDVRLFFLNISYNGRKP